MEDSRSTLGGFGLIVLGLLTIVYNHRLASFTMRLKASSKRRKKPGFFRRAFYVAQGLTLIFVGFVELYASFKV